MQNKKKKNFDLKNRSFSNPRFGSSLCVLFIGILMIGCGQRAFHKGKYDQDVERENLLSDAWSETDMQTVVKSMVENLVENINRKNPQKRDKIIMVTRLENKTSEHIETGSIMDMIRVELSNRTGIRFVDKEARGDLESEYTYQEKSVDKNKSFKGGQVGADYILNGRLDSIVQEVGKDKTVYYKLTLNLTDIRTSLVDWTSQKEIRKVYRKKRVGF